jgi:hypothetical protein
MELEASPNKPRLSLPTLEVQNNCYVVPSGGKYHYFSVKIEEDPLKPNFLYFKKTPPILVDGFVFYKKEMYQVSSDDILRLRIRKSKIVQKENLNGTCNNNGSTVAKTSPPGKTSVRNTRQPTAKHIAVLEVDLAADTTWEEQTDSLLHLISSKEGGEWEVEGIA